MKEVKIVYNKIFLPFCCGLTAFSKLLQYCIITVFTYIDILLQIFNIIFIILFLLFMNNF